MVMLLRNTPGFPRSAVGVCISRPTGVSRPHTNTAGCGNSTWACIRGAIAGPRSAYEGRFGLCCWSTDAPAPKKGWYNARESGEGDGDCGILIGLETNGRMRRTVVDLGTLPRTYRFTVTVRTYSDRMANSGVVMATDDGNWLTRDLLSVNGLAGKSMVKEQE